MEPGQSEGAMERMKQATTEDMKSELVCGQSRRREAQGSKARGKGRNSWGWLCLEEAARSDARRRPTSETRGRKI